MDVLARSCRICSLDLVNGIFVFGEDGRQMFLQAKIRKYLYITISADDNLPKIICESCCRKLEGIHKFATMAVKIQDKFNNILNTANFNSVVETNKIESKGLLHTYLTKGVNDEEEEMGEINEITEVEVKVDPMVFLQCGIEENSSDSGSDSESQCSKVKLKTNECTVCHRTFRTDLALKNHMWIHLSKSQLNYDKYSHKYIQQIAQISTAENTSSSSGDEEEEENSENGNEHIRFTCPVCAKVISTKGNLKVHLETHRPKGKYDCDICGRIFKTQCNLHRHKEYHEGIQFPCTVCGRVYPTNSTLRAHSITHSDLRPHKCPLCEKTFKRNQDLKFHINQHTGARPYQCPYCPKAFASSGNCFSHRKRMHPLEVERDKEKAAKIMR